jgi:hypothetical protein
VSATKARKNYAGTSPITRASGTKKVVLARYARNRRLGDALQQWAFCSMRGSPGATGYYQQLRNRNVGHHTALRQLANRLVGILHGCLKTRHLRRAHRLGTHPQPSCLTPIEPRMSAEIRLSRRVDRVALAGLLAVVALLTAATRSAANSSRP